MKLNYFFRFSLYYSETPRKSLTGKKRNWTLKISKFSKQKKGMKLICYRTTWL